MVPQLWLWDAAAWFIPIVGFIRTRDRAFSVSRSRAKHPPPLTQSFPSPTSHSLAPPSPRVRLRHLHLSQRYLACNGINIAS
jgi:hypothetical protein